MRQIDVFRFWLPLFASWLLMTAEGPLISAAVNRLPDEVVMLAALGIVISLAVLIESPIINLLATATALVHDRASYELVRRFTVHWIILLTAVSALVAFTPFFDWLVPGLMAVPDEVARWVRPGMRILVPWTAAIAWRRFLQGVMIHAGRTREVGLGTAVRMTTVVTTAATLLWWGRWPGVYVGAIVLLFGVFAEAVYATLAVRPVVRSLPVTAEGASAEPLTYRSLLAYHLPLAGTAVLTLMVHPLVTFTLARLDQPTLSLAAYTVITYILLMMRAGGLALPEVVIALDKTAEARAALRRFSFNLAGASLLAMMALALTPLADVYLFAFQSTTPEIAELSRHGFVLFIPLAALVSLISWLRGSLMSRRQTAAVNVGMVVRLTVMLVILGLGLAFRWPGIATAAWAINLSVAMELAYLALKRRSSA